MSRTQVQRGGGTWRRHRKLRPPMAPRTCDEHDYLCLSCGAFSGEEDFCRVCRERSRQMFLSPEWDDIGVGD